MEKKELTNPVWRKLILNQKQVRLNFMGGNILLARLKSSLKFHNSPQDLSNAENEIIELYYKNQNIPNARKDLELLLKG